MSQMDKNDVGAMLNRAVYEGDSGLLAEVADTIWEEALIEDSFPDQQFDHIMDMLQQEIFLNLEGAHRLLLLFESAWELLSDRQKARLLTELEKAYSKFSDNLAWFVASELFGEYFGDERALQVLQRLKKGEEEGPRSLVPHAFEHLIKAHHSDALARQAYEELMGMKKDPSKQVRNEANLSLQRLSLPEYEARPTIDNNS